MKRCWRRKIIFLDLIFWLSASFFALKSIFLIYIIICFQNMKYSTFTIETFRLVSITYMCPLSRNI